MRYTYETPNPDPYPDAVSIPEVCSGVAWWILGWRVEPDENTEWTGYLPRTGELVAVMVGDDRHHLVFPDEIQPIQREDYCGECGQLGCGHDGYDRTA